MFTGITAGTYPVVFVERRPGLTRLGIKLDDALLEGLVIGASVSVDGVCLTVTEVKGDVVFFDIIEETLNKTTLDTLEKDRRVNIERSLRFGSEVGGHLLSGHVFGVGVVEKVTRSPNNHIVTVRCPSEWMAYILPKGYIALDGSSLTIVDVFEEGLFTVHLIPETIRKSIIGAKDAGDRLNIELDSHTQAIVDAVKRYTATHGQPSSRNC